MPYVLVRHTVADYAKWKPFFDQHGAIRQASGSQVDRLLRNATLLEGRPWSHRQFKA